MAKIIQIKDNIVTLQGNEKFYLFQYFKFDEKTNGFVISAIGNTAKVLLTGTNQNLKINQVAEILKEKPIEAWTHFFGKIVNNFGEIVYPNVENEKSNQKETLIGTSTLFNPAPSIMDRKPLIKPLDTGILLIDTMIPIGRGQRELIIGDRVTGKSTIAINTIINASKSIKTIYVAIGQKKTNVISIYNVLSKHNALENTIILYANPDSSSEQFLAPMVGAALAEAIAYQGDDVLLILDDLSKHANVYREISLSIERNPGREAYPNDIFYVHSRLLERGGTFNEKFKNGSITILPIVETIEGDIASLIPSNIISITDGQIFTDAEKFNKGIFPAINVQLSVSRTGSAVQSSIIKFISKNLKADYTKFEEIKKFIEMSVDMNENLSSTIDQSKQLDKILEQFGNIGYSREMMAFLVLLYKNKKINGKFEMRDLTHVLKIFFEKDPIAISIKETINEINFENEKWVVKNASLLLEQIVMALNSNFGLLISKNEWENLVNNSKKDGE